MPGNSVCSTEHDIYKVNHNVETEELNVVTLMLQCGGGWHFNVVALRLACLML